jgi:hypothetical protein
VLRQHEWGIATALRGLTRRRAEHQVALREGEPGPATAAVLEGQQRALELALGSIESRVAALERYAAALEAADAAERDMERALRVSSRNDSYLDLVARTAADTLAVTELADVTEQATIPKKAYLESLHRAGLAAEVLSLPADDPNDQQNAGNRTASGLDEPPSQGNTAKAGSLIQFAVVVTDSSRRRSITGIRTCRTRRLTR